MPKFLLLTLKKAPKFSTVIEALVRLAYSRVTMVLEPGEFAVRGSIIDIFPINHSHPIRLDYDDDILERFVSFNLTTQRALSQLTKTQVAHAKNDTLFFNHTVASTGLLSEFSPGDYVVHETYGVGQFKGLTRLTIREHEGEYVWIQYKGEDKVYMPLDQLHLLHRYAGSEMSPTLNGLQDGHWKTIKEKAKRAIKLLVKELHQLYQDRLTQQGFAFGEDTESQIEFEAAFPHPCTADQLQAIQEIKSDMESPRPMDRLLCGDVGFGKTEVFIRAVFKAVENEKQVAILVPTTVLAQQHYDVFKNRFAPFPFRVEVLSRFSDKATQKKVLEDLALHRIDVIIGTHRLLNNQVQFADIGLLVIDEEQRFGVTHKEKIKTIKPNLDIISVSATPIPRTLYMALTGARALSKLETPPVQRKPVMTVVTEWSEEILKKAIQTELDRNGHVFYIYNRVETIQSKYVYLKSLFPTLSIAIAHGQLPEKQLQKTMVDFVSGKTQLLLCTTLIENGLDIPEANTIIIEGAEKFGLSQIHQLRGRVGRSPIQGYAYILYSQNGRTDTAIKRLQAIREYTSLGAGYQLAMKDLEIRGAGALLGHKQSGHITAVGFELYCKLLEEAITPNKTSQPILMSTPFYIPETYIESERERLAIYQRMQYAPSRFALEDLIEELQDRYGEIPKIVMKTLESLMRQGAFSNSFSLGDASQLS